ncbi:MAG: hypothetical protein Q9227_005121 [Pyrenula ochraceoflavens]
MRWVEEKKHRELERRAAASELLGEDIPPRSEYAAGAQRALPLSSERKSDTPGGPPKSLPNVEYEVEEADELQNPVARP